MLVQQRQVHLVSDNRLATEASELGLKPGQWPTELYLVGDSEPTRFARVAQLHSADEVIGYEYRSDGGLLLTVFND